MTIHPICHISVWTEVADWTYCMSDWHCHPYILDAGVAEITQEEVKEVKSESSSTWHDNIKANQAKMKHMFYQNINYMDFTQCRVNKWWKHLCYIIFHLDEGSQSSRSYCGIVGNWTCFSFLKTFHLFSECFMKHLQETETRPVAYDIALRIIFHHTIYWNHPHRAVKVAFRLQSITDTIQ